jgi:L-ascorbate metabolism protein UlaG (beta-lactamase superfamily)
MMEQPGFDEVADRVRVPSLSWGACEDLAPNGVKVRVCRVPHSGSPELTNHLYRVNLGGFRFVHEGDADLSAATFQDLGLANEGLDLAFLHSWWVTSDAGRKAVRRWLEPKAIVLMHHRWATAPETRERLARLSPEVLEELPPVKVFSAEAEREIFHRQR